MLFDFANKDGEWMHSEWIYLLSAHGAGLRLLLLLLVERRECASEREIEQADKGGD